MTQTSQGRVPALVQAALDAQGIKQADLARQLDMSESSLSTLIHRPKTQIPIDPVARLAVALGIHVGDMLAAYSIDAGVPSTQFDLPNQPERVVVVGAMDQMSEKAQKRLAQIAQDFRDDGK